MSDKAILICYLMFEIVAIIYTIYVLIKKINTTNVRLMEELERANLSTENDEIAALKARVAELEAVMRECAETTSDPDVTDAIDKALRGEGKND